MDVDVLKEELVKEKRKYKCLQGKYNKEVVLVAAENKRLSGLVESLDRQLREDA